MDKITLDIPEGRADLPEGYHYGAHVSDPARGRDGYYVIRDSDGAACVGWQRRDLDEAPTAEEIDEAIKSARVES